MNLVSSNWFFYLNYFIYLGTGIIHNTAHDFRVSLLKPTYTPDITTHSKWTEINSHEIVAYSYPIGGISMANKSYTINSTEQCAYWSGSDVIFYMGDVVDVKYIVIYDNTPTYKPLVCWAYIDASTTSVSGANFKVNIGDIYNISSRIE